MYALACEPTVLPVGSQKTTCYAGGGHIFRYKLQEKTSNDTIGVGLATAPLEAKEVGLMNKSSDNSLAHTKWECKYHIVFAPKYRRQIIYGKIRADIGKILRELCERKGVEIIEAECCKDHIHMLVRIPPKYSVSEFMGYLKGKSSLMIFDRHANLKYKYGNRNFWCRGYYVDTVGKNAKKIEAYIRNQLVEDKMQDQLTLREYTDPFTGEPESRNRR